MKFTINYENSGRVDLSEHHSGTLVEAKYKANVAVEENGYERAEVRGQDGKLLYQFPRTTRAGG